jgi:hypothetical protein
MPTDYLSQVLEPPISEWPSMQVRLGDASLQALRSEGRRRLLTAAEQYRQKLTEIGLKSGLLQQSTTLLTGDPDASAIVMTGHQPVIFHSGLTFKYKATEEFAAANNAIGLAIVIDTDEGDAGDFSYPQRAQVDSRSPGDHSSAVLDDWPQVTTATASFAQTSSSYATSRKKAADDVMATASLVTAGLQSCGCDESAVKFQATAEQYAAVQTDLMVEANLIVRWNAGIGGRMLELPLSAVCRFPEVVRFFAEILARPFEFADCYNETLNTFRADQKIRNEANPFPNVQRENLRTELPFWIVDTKAGTRSVVAVRKQGIERVLETAEGVLTELLPGNEAATIFSLMMSGHQLIPRGALITTMLRLLFSDLFVHGTGGGKYDRCTDQLIRKWWHVEPTPFAVASASRYLFTEQRTQLSHLQTIVEQMRDLQFNPQRHFGTGIFSAEMEERLGQMLVTRDDAVQRLKQARETGQSARDIGMEIQRIADDVKAFVGAEFSPQMAMFDSLSTDTIATWNNRTWPWLFF